MKNVTFSADDALIERARARAQANQTTLNDAFRKWLVAYTEGVESAEQAERAIATIRELQKYIDTGGRKFTREELNER